MKSKKKIVLAYSGGLDTSVILKWLQENFNAEVGYVPRKGFFKLSSSVFEHGLLLIYINCISFFILFSNIYI